jgi:hypothetical protein
VEGAAVAVLDGEEAGEATGQTDGIGRRRDTSTRKTTTAPAPAAGAGATEAAAAAAAEGATHGGAGASGHRLSPAGVPGAEEDITTEFSSSNTFLLAFFVFCFSSLFSSNLYHSMQ